MSLIVAPLVTIVAQMEADCLHLGIPCVNVSKVFLSTNNIEFLTLMKAFPFYHLKANGESRMSSKILISWLIMFSQLLLDLCDFNRCPRTNCWLPSP